MMQIEIQELCKAILSFEGKTQQLRESLFLHPQFTDTLLWNYISNASVRSISLPTLKTFIDKHREAHQFQSLHLLFRVYSSKRDNTLSKGDLWEMIKPRSKLAGRLNVERNRRHPYPSCGTMHYKIVDRVLQLIERIVQFEEVAQLMKRNILAAKEELFITPLDMKHIQVYLGFNAEDTQIVVGHIIRDQPLNQLNFYSFFLPEPSSGRINPCHAAKDQQELALALTHSEVGHYGSKAVKKKKSPYFAS